MDSRKSLHKTCISGIIPDCCQLNTTVRHITYVEATILSTNNLLTNSANPPSCSYELSGPLVFAFFPPSFFYPVFFSFLLFI
ncbi:hypothetical protein BDV32DRAFT_118439 [Aspergillus pseudonomiae]|nr:hypothetical protein BDV32DRAFT_118439 [Aspergillus pseudonomiae]